MASRHPIFVDRHQSVRSIRRTADIIFCRLTLTSHNRQRGAHFPITRLIRSKSELRRTVNSATKSARARMQCRSSLVEHSLNSSSDFVAAPLVVHCRHEWSLKTSTRWHTAHPSTITIITTRVDVSYVTRSDIFVIRHFITIIHSFPFIVSLFSIFTWALSHSGGTRLMVLPNLLLLFFTGDFSKSAEGSSSSFIKHSQKYK